MERVSRNDRYYKACLAASTAAGAISGKIVAGFSAPVTGGLSLATVPLGGIAVGFSFGYLACPYLAPAIRSKIERDLPLDDFAMDQSIRAMSLYAAVHNPYDAVKLLALVRTVPKNMTDAPVCSSPQMDAKALLVQLKSVG
ncbi:MAG: hypothetical protein AAGA12_12095 [Pseudomonadota bacterium]